MKWWESPVFADEPPTSGQLAGPEVASDRRCGLLPQPGTACVEASVLQIREAIEEYRSLE